MVECVIVIRVTRGPHLCTVPYRWRQGAARGAAALPPRPRGACRCIRRSSRLAASFPRDGTTGRGLGPTSPLGHSGRAHAGVPGSLKGSLASPGAPGPLAGLAPGRRVVSESRAPESVPEAHLHGERSQCVNALSGTTLRGPPSACRGVPSWPAPLIAESARHLHW